MRMFVNERRMQVFSTPKECYDYIIKNNLEMPVLGTMMNHLKDYSIAEIADARFHITAGVVSITSAGYRINVPITDDEIATAVLNGIYVSAFISRKEDKYQIHFLVSGYPKEMKCKYEEEIAKDVVRYMIMSTITACRLDSEKKLREYINNGADEMR